MLEHESDGTIVDLVLQGRRDAFVFLVHRYQGALYRVAFNRLGDACLAEDVVQETFLNAFRSLSQYNSRYSFRTWLWTILLNQCHRQWRRGQRTPLATPGVAPEPSSSEGPLSQLLLVERNEQLRSRLERLPDPQADALRLRFFGGLKFQEIADVMDCSLSTAKNRVRAGLAELGRALQGKADDSTQESLS